MAGKGWEECLRNRVKLTLYYVNNPCMAGEILTKALSCMTEESYDDSCAVNVSHYGRKLWSSYENLCVTVIMPSLNPERIKVTDEPKDKNDMQVCLAKRQ